MSFVSSDGVHDEQDVEGFEARDQDGLMCDVVSGIFDILISTCIPWQSAQVLNS